MTKRLIRIPTSLGVHQVEVIKKTSVYINNISYSVFIHQDTKTQGMLCVTDSLSRMVIVKFPAFYLNLHSIDYRQAAQSHVDQLVSRLGVDRVTEVIKQAPPFIDEPAKN